MAIEVPPRPVLLPPRAGLHPHQGHPRPERQCRFVLDDPLLVWTFTRCLLPTHLPDVAVNERAAIDALLAENLMLRLDDCVVTLPYRMTRWPIPATVV